ncbi:sulfurtransferase TusA family protein [Sneathiella aquimaris]|uniref:sulfurtransferase TusA family protein n=1 Tax=Sneathiella aquimaris TaxID=2599305 RepID=UPI00146D0B68
MSHILDTSGLSCPLPVLKAKKKIKELQSGDILTVIATDPASRIDIDHFCHISGNPLLSSEEKNGVFTYRIAIS